MRDPADVTAWREFEERYRGLILRFCWRRGLQATDAEDICQVTLLSLAQALPRFEYSPARGRFRHYLGRIVQNAINQDFSSPSSRLKPLETDVLESLEHSDSTLDADWEQEWVDHHYRIALARVRQRRDTRSVQVFQSLLDGNSVADAAQEFGLSLQAVHKIKQRIRKDLKDQVRAQIADEDGR